MTKHPQFLSEKDSVSAAEYALGVMQGEARANFAKRLTTNAALAAEVRQWDEHFAEFAGEIVDVEPPKQIAKVLEKRLFSNSVVGEKLSFWNSLGLWRGLTAASMAAVIALGAWNLRPLPEATSDKAMVAQMLGESPLKLAAYYNPASGELRLNRIEGAAHVGRSLELWIIAEKEAPVSLGVLADAASTKVTVPVALREKFSKGVLAITDEPAGGSPSGGPTGAVLAAGPLTDV